MMHALDLKSCGRPTQISKPYRGEHTLSSHGLLMHERRSVTLQMMRRMTRRTRAQPSIGKFAAAQQAEADDEDDDDEDEDDEDDDEEEER